jgi:hypothetical protein
LQLVVALYSLICFKVHSLRRRRLRSTLPSVGGDFGVFLGLLGMDLLTAAGEPEFYLPAAANDIQASRDLQ